MDHVLEVRGEVQILRIFCSDVVDDSDDFLVWLPDKSFDVVRHLGRVATQDQSLGVVLAEGCRRTLLTNLNQLPD